MTPPTLTFHGRLPGVECDPTPPVPERPIRLDVAGFVGFAQRGPIDVPVTLTDPGGFDPVFGGDLVLADDSGRPAYAHLRSAVSAFFDNGGIKCHVVRVAGPNALSSLWELSGVAHWSLDGGVQPVGVVAASPGRWSANLRLTAQPSRRPLAGASSYRRAGDDPLTQPGVLDLPPASAASLQPGDLLHLARAAGVQLYARVLRTFGGTVVVDREYAWRNSPTGPRPAPEALGTLPDVAGLVAVWLLRLDVVVQRQDGDRVDLVERLTDLAYSGLSSPGLTGSSVVRVQDDAGALASGLVVPGLPRPATPVVSGTDDLDTFDPWACFVEAGGVLRGIHTLAAVEEVALLSCPDLVQRPWSWVSPAPPDVDPPSPPAAPPTDWSDFSCCDPEVPAPPVVTTAPAPIAPARLGLTPAATYQLAPLVAVQTAMIQLCAARADMVAVLGLPGHFETSAVTEWHDLITNAPSLVAARTTAFAPLSYSAVWHPWLSVTEPTSPRLAPLRQIPPDGAICGLIAARELQRGVWVAPALRDLRGPVDLAPRVDAVALFDNHVNVVVKRPGAFAPLAAHTLAEGNLLQLNVRRLLIWLRLTVLRIGERYVFEVNTERFRDTVRARFERLLGQLVEQGALHAGRVSVSEDPLDAAEGRLLISIEVAPTSPVEFITVTLIRTGQGLLDIREA